MISRLLPLSALLLTTMLATGCGSTRDLSASQARVQERATQVALSMVGKPYHYGGNTPDRGFDCSGLVQYSYGRAGVKLLHGNRYLERASRSISKSDLRRGDLVFFDQEGKSASHVGIYVGDNRFVHAPSSGKRVHVVDFSKYWHKHFNEARRIDVD